MTTTDAARTERSKTRNAKPDVWIPVDVGDTLVGTVTDIAAVWSDNRNNGKGGFYPLLTLQAIETSDEDNFYPVNAELKLHCFRAIPLAEVMRKRPGLGSQFTIVYKGTGEAKRGQNPPELYSIRISGDGEHPAYVQRAYADIEASDPHRGGRLAGDGGDIPTDDTPF